MISITNSMSSPKPGGMYQMFDKYLGAGPVPVNTLGTLVGYGLTRIATLPEKLGHSTRHRQANI